MAVVSGMRSFCSYAERCFPYAAGLSTPTALDGSNAPTPAPDRQIVPENRWMVLCMWLSPRFSLPFFQADG